MRNINITNRSVCMEVVGYLLEELRDAANFRNFKKDIASANIFIGSLIFIEELAEKVRRALGSALLIPRDMTPEPFGSVVSCSDCLMSYTSPMWSGCSSLRVWSLRFEACPELCRCQTADQSRATQTSAKSIAHHNHATTSSHGSQGAQPSI